MSVKVEKLSGCKVKIRFTLDSTEFDNAIDRAFEKKVQEIEVKGFRKGKLPREVFNRKFGEESLYDEAANMCINEAYASAIEKHKLEVVGKPELDVDFTTVGRGKKMKFTIDVEVWPDVELGQYKEIEVTKEPTEVTPADIDAYIDRAKKNYAELEIVENGELEKGHTAVFDFEGFVDGVPFEGGKAENYSLEIGSNQFIPGFEEQMVGMKVDEERTIKVKFPEDYQAENLKGKDAEFKVKLHEIKKRILPELNEEFVKELDIKEVSTVEDYQKYVLETLQKEKTEASDNKFANDVLTQAIENAKLEIPQSLVDEEINRHVNQMESQAETYKIPVESLLKYYGIENIEQYKKAIEPTAIMNVKQRAVFLKIAEVEKVKLTEKDYNEEFEAVAAEYNKPLEEIKKVYNKELLAPYLKMKKVIDLIKSTAKIK